MSPIVRPAVASDAAGVAEVFADYVATLVTFETTAPTATEWLTRIEGGYPFVVLTDADEVLGYALASPWRGKPAYQHTVETTVYLAQAQTGKGHGRRLLEALLTACAEAGFHQAIAVIVDTGGASVGLHKAVGFQEAGRLTRVGHKDGRWLDTLLLQKEIHVATA
jgi:phosphinothricin acetyltransferase